MLKHAHPPHNFNQQMQTHLDFFNTILPEPMSPMGNPDLQQIHDFLIELAFRGGQMMLDANPSTQTSGSKKNCKLYFPL